MKVTFTPTRVQKNGYTSPMRSVNKVSNSAYVPQIISFAGNNSNQIAIVVAETKPYFSVGGVATVASDYISGKVFDPNKEIILFSPYYNGQRFYNENGKLMKDVEPLMDDQKRIWMTNGDLKEKTLSEIDSGAKWELEKVASKKMDWAGASEDIALYQVKGKKHFIVFTDDTARMPKPYADGSYSTAGIVRKLGDGGDPYAKYCKALTEFIPELEAKGISPGHYLLNDAQTAYFAEYAARKSLLGIQGFKDIKMSFVQHNLGEGYQGMTSLKDMFYNFATNKQVESVLNDPDYFVALKQGNEEKYFLPFFKSDSKDASKKLIRRTDDAVSASMIPIRYAMMGNLTGISPVSERYAESAASDERVAKGLTEFLKKLKEMNRYRGILNGMSNDSIDPTKIPGPKLYQTEQTVEVNGKTLTFKPFETFDPKWFSEDAKSLPADIELNKIPQKDVKAAEKVMAIKRRNMINLFERLQEGVPYQYAIGKEKEGYGLMGHISADVLEKARKGDVNLFVSWGRGDEQKGLDVVMDAFKKFVYECAEKGKTDSAYKEMAENTVLVLGGELKGYCAEDLIKMKMAAFKSDPLLQGRIVFMNGFAPNSVLASAGLAPMFPSRFAPCELTDLEAMKYAATPIVTDLQGLAQKNFDPRKPAGKSTPTSYTTNANSYMSIEDVKKADKEFAELFAKKEAYFNNEYKNAVVKTGRGTRSYSAEEIAKFVAHKLEKDAELIAEYKKATDRLIADDLVKAMLQRILDKKDPSLKAKNIAMIRNTILAKVGWRENEWLHPDGKSSSQIYQDFHLDQSVKPFSETLFDYNYAPKSRLGLDMHGKGGNMFSSGFDSFGSSSRFFNKRVLGIAAGVAVAGGVIYHLFSKKSTPKKHPSSFIA